MTNLTGASLRQCDLCVEFHEYTKSVNEVFLRCLREQGGGLFLMVFIEVGSTLESFVVVTLIEDISILYCEID